MTRTNKDAPKAATTDALTHTMSDASLRNALEELRLYGSSGVFPKAGTLEGLRQRIFETIPASPSIAAKILVSIVLEEAAHRWGVSYDRDMRAAPKRAGLQANVKRLRTRLDTACKMLAEFTTFPDQIQQVERFIGRRFTKKKSASPVVELDSKGRKAAWKCGARVAAEAYHKTTGTSKRKKKRSRR